MTLGELDNMTLEEIDNLNKKCPKCGSRNTFYTGGTAAAAIAENGSLPEANDALWQCGDCGHIFDIYFKEEE